MLIKTLIRHPKGSVIDLPGAQYTPVTQPDGEQVFEVNDAEHAARLLAIKEGFAEYAPGDTPAAAVKAAAQPAEVKKPADIGLLGSSVHAANYEIGGKAVQLGTLVAAAHTASGLTVTEWNALDAEARHELIDHELDKLMAEEDAEIKAAAAKANSGVNTGEMSKPELVAYAKVHFPTLKLNTRAPLPTLRKQVATAIAAKAQP